MWEALRATWHPGAPAFWSACGGPASPHRRGRERDDWRTATTPMARRRPPPEPEKMHWNALSRGLPGSAIVWSPPRCRVVVPAQWRARHAPMGRHTPADSEATPARPVWRHIPADSEAGSGIGSPPDREPVQVFAMKMVCLGPFAPRRAGTVSTRTRNPALASARSKARSGDADHTASTPPGRRHRWAVARPFAW